MLRQYHTTRGVGGGGFGLTGPGGGGGVDSGWALKDSRDVTPSGQVQPMSSRILAVGVMLVGVLVLSVALIMGLEFPKYVFSQFREDQCVVHSRHQNFPSWRDGSQWRREVRVYYHHLLNPDQFLYHGAQPLFQERGPYVYEEHETRDDVTFSVTEVTFRVTRRHQFSVTATARECSRCHENDTLTVVNTDYLRHTYRSGGHENYLLSELPPTLTALLESQGLYLPADHTFPPNVTLLGCLHPPACDDALPAPAANISFGKWLRTSTSPHSSLVLSNRNGVSFTPSEVGGVYTALMNATVLGSGVFRSRTTSQTQCQTWARSLCQGLSLPASLVDFDSKVCGLVHILQLCQSESLLRTEVKNLFVSSFCPSPGVVCLDLSTVANQLVLSAYFQVFQDYVLNYLLQVLHDFLIARVNRDLVVTRTQRELALGYDVSTSVDQSASSHVQGLLDDYWLKSANSKGSLWKVNTCLKDRNMNNNMKVREFGGSQYAPQEILRKDSISVRFSGQTDFFPACKPVSCCACASPGPSVHHFLPTLQRALRYTDSETVSLWDTEVYRYWLSQDSFTWSSRYVVSCGLQELTSSLGFVGWVSVPQLTSGHLQREATDHHNCSLPKLQSFLDIEPVTGRVWQRVTQMQMNAGIRLDDVTGPRWRPLNVTYLLKPVPIVWTERKITLSDGELGYYNNKVRRLLGVSCGGLIGLAILAALVAGLGFVILLRPKKIKRVSPAAESDLSTSNLHSRHFNPT